MIVVPFFDVTKPASICNHNAFEIMKMIHLNNMLVTYWNVDFTLLFEYSYFSADFWPIKFGCEFS